MYDPVDTGSHQSFKPDSFSLRGGLSMHFKQSLHGEDMPSISCWLLRMQFSKVGLKTFFFSFFLFFFLSGHILQPG